MKVRESWSTVLDQYFFAILIVSFPNMFRPDAQLAAPRTPSFIHRNRFLHSFRLSFEEDRAQLSVDEDRTE